MAKKYNLVGTFANIALFSKSGVAKLSELMERKTHEFSNKTVTGIIELMSPLEYSGIN
ncbi:hypothetical protein C8R34_1079 [Nitrosomonas sp. Nm84]|nr:hypothetical protein C8R34_1079 [Nitrosomonas sp. Nm84]